jgi:hypothetical protein
LAEIPLGDAPVDLRMDFENGGIHSQRQLVWAALDLSVSRVLHARTGDSLKCVIPPSADGRIEAVPPIGPAVTVPLGAQTGIYRFPAPGKYLLRWISGGIRRAVTTVQVHPTGFGSNVPSALMGSVREVTPSYDTRPLAGDGGDALQVVMKRPLAASEQLVMAIQKSGACNFGFRDPLSGRLVSLMPMNVIRVVDAFASEDSASFDSGNVDTNGVTYRMAFSDLPKGWTIEVSIFRAGVTFRDGSIVKNFTRDDLANGILSLEMLHPPVFSGGLCHRFIIRDASGFVVR